MNNHESRVTSYELRISQQMNFCRVSCLVSRVSCTLVGGIYV
jgi:hypothetical protein